MIKMSRSRFNRTTRTLSGVAVASGLIAAETGGSGRIGRARRRFTRQSLMFKVVSGLLGMALVGGGAFAATNWIVGLNAGSSGEGQSGTVSNLTIAAVASPAATNP